MSFWNFLGEFAFLNMIWNWFSGKPKYCANTLQPSRHYTDEAEYLNRIDELNQEIDDSKKKIAGYRKIIDDNKYSGSDFDDTDDLQSRIDELEDQLADCDIMSERYDRIQDKIDMLQNRLDEIEDNQDALDDWQSNQDLYNDRDDDLLLSDDWDDDL